MFHKEQNYVKIILCKNEKTQLNVEHQRAAMHLKFFSLISLEAWSKLSTTLRFSFCLNTKFKRHTNDVGFVRVDEL